MKIAMVIASLGSGGAERVMSTLANRLSARHEVTLVTLASSESDFYRLEPRVRRVALDVAGASRGALDAVARNVRRIRALAAAIDRTDADVVLSFCDVTNVMVLIAASRRRVVVSERVDPRSHPIGRVWSAARRGLYRRAAAVVVQTESIRSHVREFVPASRVLVIPNPIAPTEPHVDREFRRIIAAGRLNRQKGFDLLIEAFATVAAQIPDWTLDVFGEGEERASLERMIAAKGLVDRVMLRGKSATLASELAHADLFVLSSRYEGFPNVLLEAMATGLAVVAFNVPTGPQEIIRHNLDGVLVPAGDVRQFGHAIRDLALDPDRRRMLGTRAVDVKERFAVDEIAGRWERLLFAAAKGEPVAEITVAATPATPPTSG